MAIPYPEGLPLPLENKVKEQTRTSRETQPLSGPAYTESLSDDAPAFYQLNFTFDPINSLVFRAWVESNNIHNGVEFDLPLRTEATAQGSGDARETQIVRVVDGDPRSSTNNGMGVYKYSFTVRCRKEVTGLEEWYDLIADGGAYLLLGAPLLDIAINREAPLD